MARACIAAPRIATRGRAMGSDRIVTAGVASHVG